MSLQLQKVLLNLINTNKMKSMIALGYKVETFQDKCRMSEHHKINGEIL